MRTINFTTRFKKDYRREKAGRHGKHLDGLLQPVLASLAADELLAPRYRDHALSGDWQDHRDCHVRPDLVLIYRLVGDDGLDLVRLGSHSELGL